MYDVVDKLVETEFTEEVLLIDGVQALCKPLFSSLFVCKYRHSVNLLVLHLQVFSYSILFFCKKNDDDIVTGGGKGSEIMTGIIISEHNNKGGGHLRSISAHGKLFTKSHDFNLNCQLDMEKLDLYKSKGN